MSLTLAEAVLVLRHALGDEGEAVRAEVEAARSASGVVDDDVPAYLPGALVAMLGGETSPAPLALAERGYAWLLTDVAPLLPNAEVLDGGSFDALWVPRLGRALVITRGSAESWQVLEHRPDPS